MSVTAPDVYPGGTPPARRPGAPATPRGPAMPERGVTRNRARPRGRTTTAFWLMTAFVVTLLIVGLVSLSALLVRSSFAVEELRESISALEQEQQTLSTDVVTLSAPSRIAAWARHEGMVVAEGADVLRVGSRDRA